MHNEKLLNEIIKRLDILIMLELQKPLSENVPYVNRIERLKSLSLTPAEIAKIIGKPTNYVTATLSKKKKVGGKKRGGTKNDG